ncbi:MAG TPA: OmpH family outer membrane protein [Ferruginibacter sp.]|jgi:outer membrane protein|nr:OmpH family outer membrane protein [Bacteroidota bacterium]MBS1925680.1 OmpH family outer membrane protein [Bacteroidota bacterium]HMT96158.1 OmpH family outer membrane protein [Ferruginibacter sp.]HMU24006.1 OmpH family outer membrane protein [Ferruginibacter sp.]
MKKLLVAAAMIFGLFTTASAQSKIGYINSDELMGDMPEAAKADAELKQFQTDLGKQGQDLMNELNTKDSLFVKDSTSYSPSIKEIKRNELIKLYQRVQGWQNEAQELYQAEAQKKIVPIRNKALDAIKAVAKENGYGYVFDNAQGSLLIAPPGDDLLPLVKKKLGIAANAVPVKKN